MSWRSLTSPAGRIGRRSFNIAAFGLVALLIVGVLLASLGAFSMKLADASTGPLSGAMIVWDFFGPANTLDWVVLVVGAIVAAFSLWSLCALIARRLHDHDRSCWRMTRWLPLWALTFAIVLHPDVVSHLPRAVRITAFVVAVLGFGSVLWQHIELSWRRGTPGDNRFGPPAHG